MKPRPPRARVPRADRPLLDVEGLAPEASWAAAHTLPGLRLAERGQTAAQPTRVETAWDDQALYVRFRCIDRDPWGSYRERDDPIWREEAVEVFLAPGVETPRTYFEFEVSPHGVLFDALVRNPDGERASLDVAVDWNCGGVLWRAGLDGDGWWAALALPWAPLGERGSPVSRLWRANFYRIDRPRDGSPAEFSCWSPTLRDPPDFHRPERFGLLLLD